MKLVTRLIVAVVPCVCLMLPSGASAVVTGQFDDFEDGTTQNWVINLLGLGSPPPAAIPQNISTGGPAGANDNYLQLTAVGGGGSGGRLSAINVTQWTGDFLDAGIIGIAMDLNNFGPDDLSLRLLFADPTVAPPTNVAFSTAPVVVPAGSGWTSVVFAITPGDLTAGTGSVVDALTGATEMRLFHNPSAAFPGPGVGIPAVNAVLGVDNIRAVVPAPSALVLAGLGVLTVFSRRRGRPRRARP